MKLAVFADISLGTAKKSAVVKPVAILLGNAADDVKAKLLGKAAERLGTRAAGYRAGQCGDLVAVPEAIAAIGQFRQNDDLSALGLRRLRQPLDSREITGAITDDRFELDGCDGYRPCG